MNKKRYAILVLILHCFSYSLHGMDEPKETKDKNKKPYELSYSGGIVGSCAQFTTFLYSKIITSKFREACNNDVVTIKKTLAQPMLDINESKWVGRSEDGGFHGEGHYWTPLHEAVYDKKPHIIKQLLSHPSIDVNKEDNLKRIPLHWAAMPRFDKRRDNTYDEGKLLLEDKRSKINAMDKSGKTPLVYAINNHNQLAVTTLLSHGANVDIASDKQKTPIHEALDYNNYEALEILLEAGANIHTQDSEENNTPLHYAMMYKNKRFLSLLWSYGAKDELYVPNKALLTPFEQLFLQWDAKKAQFLLNNGFDVNKPNSATSFTPLHTYAYAERATEPHLRHSIIGFLLNNGAEASLLNSNGDTPLHLTNNHDIAHDLLRHGAQVNVQNKKAETPLHKALAQYEPNYLFVEALINHGGDLNIQNNDGNTPLHFFVEAYKSCHEYKERRCNNGSYYPIFKKIAAFLAKQPIDFSISNKNGSTILHIACEKRQCRQEREAISKGLIGILIFKGAQRTQDEDGKYPDDYVDNPEIKTMIQEGMTQSTATREKLLQKHGVRTLKLLCRQKIRCTPSLKKQLPEFLQKHPHLFNK